MPDDFDPYLDWLGIPVTSRPPNHYQLLGLSEFEADMGRILAAADQRMQEIRSYQTGPRGKYTQKVLNELSSAKLCLLDAKAKATYDAALRQQRAAPQMVYAAAMPAYLLSPDPPIAEPPTAAPPTSPRLPASEHVFRSLGVETEATEPEPGSGWLWAVAAICVLVIISASVAMYRYSASKRQPIATADKDASIADQPHDIPAPPPPATDEPLRLVQEGNGDLSFANSLAELSEGLSRVEREGSPLIEGWKDDTTVARWNFKLVKPAVFEIRIEYTVENAGNAQWQLRIGEETKVRELQTSDGGNKTVADAFFWRVPRGGEHTLELSLSQLPDAGQVTLKSLRFVYQGGQLK